MKEEPKAKQQRNRKRQIDGKKKQKETKEETKERVPEKRRTVVGFSLVTDTYLSGAVNRYGKG